MIESSHVPLVSVCIPTHQRAGFLELALRSVLAQTYESVEILVSDDSSDHLSQFVVDQLRAETLTEIRYTRNSPKLGQNANVDRLFREASGSYIILLHDDDLLLPGAIKALMSPVLANSNVLAVFGKQNLIDGDGVLLPEATHDLNSYFGRQRASCLIDNPLEACLMQQWPNDCYLIQSRLAQAVGCRSESEIGARVDVDFGIRVGQALKRGEMWFIDAFIGSYRRSDESLSNSSYSRKAGSPLASVALYKFVTSLELPASSEYARQFLLRTFIDSMLKGFALLGDRASAMKLYFSSAYGWRKRLSVKGAYHLALVISPKFDKFRRY